MCGIVGILGSRPAAPIVIEALRRLEYRGYDSAGVATLADGYLHRRRAEGKVANLEERIINEPILGTVGIGHTRWATHGEPVERNAHPHATELLSLVHNGIIENYQELKGELMKAGVTFESDTDTEVVAQLIHRKLERGYDPQTAVFDALQRLRGAFAFAIIFKGYDDLMVAARNGSPLIVGYGDGGVSVGSDALALAGVAEQVAYLENGDLAVLSRQHISIFDRAGLPAERPYKAQVASALLVDTGGYRHFMLKEIHEQPEVVGHTFGRYCNFSDNTIVLPEDFGVDFTFVSRVSITACGTAFYAGSIAKYWFEQFAGLPVDLDIASEYRYREPPVSKNAILLVISQSGETADSLESLRLAKAEGMQTVAIVNVPESSIAREADYVLPTFAGPEIGVASTKAFTCQLAALLALALSAAQHRGYIHDIEVERAMKHLGMLPGLMSQALALDNRVAELAQIVARSDHAIYLGRGTSYPLALEGALKLTEISYIHAQGFGAGELKHGPIALIDETMPVIAIAPFDDVWFEKTISNVHEVAARKGKVILMTDARGAKAAAMEGVETLILPEMQIDMAPLVYAIPLQLLAYHVALLKGTDVDKPRNLAKSVTVE